MTFLYAIHLGPETSQIITGAIIIQSRIITVASWKYGTKANVSKAVFDMLSTETKGAWQMVAAAASSDRK